MKYLLYCVFEPPADRTIVAPSRMEGQSVNMVEKEGLRAAFSEISDAGPAYDISEIKRYHGVIEWFFSQVTVIPFRFGTMLDEYPDVVRLLEKRAEDYKKMLSELEGCAEVGIRVIIDEGEIPREGSCCADLPSLGCPNPGKLYLSNRRAHYWTETVIARLSEKATEPYRRVFGGMFEKYRREEPKVSVEKNRRRTLVVSMYFLVPRNLLARFREAFVEMSSKDTAKSMLTGPWPPYNFVLPGDHPHK